ncbi:MAG TPA: putative oxidoreductase C-terminal domain-containing protein, partial [Chitinophagaceae bacterium]
MNKIYWISIATVLFMTCNPVEKNEKRTFPVRLITLDPGHFHAALVQKIMYDNVDSIVHVYAPEGNDLQLHLDRIKSFNKRAEDPTHWKGNIYAGRDYFETMLAEKNGNVVVLAGNNQKKTDYILRSLQNGFNVFADKPMVIDSKGFEQLKETFTVAEKNKLLLYDIMTERYEITTMLQRELSMIPEIFGTLEKGTPENPAITKESVHHFYKYVSGSVLTRPAWFLDVSQQGEGIVDVMTHLVDLVQWECFPEQVIDYTKDIVINTAKRWSTDIALSQFREITKLESFPAFLNDNISHDSLLNVSCNGEINYTIKGVHAKTSVIWNYKAPNGAGDTHYSIMRGTKASLVIRQGPEEDYKSTLYIEPINADTGYKLTLTAALVKLREKYPGLEVTGTASKIKAIIPDKLKEGHEAHFG